MSCGDPKDVCPNCGYCPHCGRGYKTYPSYPMPWYPLYPSYPLWQSGASPQLQKPFTTTAGDTAKITFEQ